MDIIAATAGPNVDKDLLSSAQKKNKSDSPDKDIESGKKANNQQEDEDSGWCSAFTKYFTVKHY